FGAAVRVTIQSEVTDSTTPHSTKRNSRFSTNQDSRLVGQRFPAPSTGCSEFGTSSCKCRVEGASCDMVRGTRGTLIRKREILPRKRRLGHSVSTPRLKEIGTTVMN